VEVSGNTAGLSQVNIFLHGDNAEVEHNRTFAAKVFDGIRIQGNQTRARNNQVFDGGEAGFFLSGNNNIVSENIIALAPIGILEDTGASGDVIVGNRFFNTPVPFKDPQSIDVSTLISPKR
jgi:hypothetical protein